MSPFAILDAIRRHRSSAQTRLRTLRLELAAIEKEAEELAIAERVVQRLTGEPVRDVEAYGHLEDGSASHHEDPRDHDGAGGDHRNYG